MCFCGFFRWTRASGRRRTRIAWSGFRLTFSVRACQRYILSSWCPLKKRQRKFICIRLADDSLINSCLTFIFIKCFLLTLKSQLSPLKDDKHPASFQARQKTHSLSVESLLESGNNSSNICLCIPQQLVFNSVTNCLGPRKFLHSGKLFKAKSSKELYGFLFNDFLLLTQVSPAPLYSLHV